MGGTCLEHCRRGKAMTKRPSAEPRLRFLEARGNFLENSTFARGGASPTHVRTFSRISHSRFDNIFRDKVGSHGVNFCHVYVCVAFRYCFSFFTGLIIIA